MARTAPRRAKKATRPAIQVHDARSDKAWRSVQEFRKMLPSMSAFARMMTGDRSVTVHVGRQGAQSLDNKIYIAPPIELGETMVHVHHVCGKRLPNGRQECQACDRREVILFYLYHEVAHISGGTFEDSARWVIDKLSDLIDEWHPEEACSHGAGMKRELNREDANYGYRATVVNEFLPTVFNALEDARVDATMFRARPGLRILFRAATLRIFDDGIKLPSGEVLAWTDQPVNSQGIIGLFLKASGHKVEPEWFDPRVLEVLEDAQLIDICNKVILTRSSHQVMDLSIQAFRRLFELGLCQVPKCVPVPPPPPAPPAPEPEADDEEKDAGDEPDEGDPSEGDPGSEAGGDAGESDGDSDDGTPGDPGSSDGADEQSDGDPGDGSKDDDDRSDSKSGSSGRGSGDDEDQQDAGGAGEPGNSDGSSEAEEGSDDGQGDDQDGPQADDTSPATGDVSEVDPEGDPEGKDGTGARPSASGTGDIDGGSSESNPVMDGAPSADASGEDDNGDQEGQDADDSGERGPGAASDRPEAGKPEDEGTGTGEPAEAHDADGTASDSDEVFDNGPGAGPSGPTPELEKAGEEVWDEEYAEPDHPVFDPGEAGSTDLVMDVLKALTGHGHIDGGDQAELQPGYIDGDEPDGTYSARLNEEQNAEAVRIAVGQSSFFSMRSNALNGVQVAHYPQPQLLWPAYSPGVISDWMASERLIGKALQHARLTFEANKRAKNEHNMRAGRINPRVLGRRAPTGDDRLFSKKTIPSKKSYFVAIGMDISGSTSYGERLPRIKRATLAQAETLNRLGIPFAIYACSGGPDFTLPFDTYENNKEYVWMLEVKAPEEPWTNVTRQRLIDLSPTSENYDGHNLEFLRKILDRRQETDKITIYYTDGAMPAANGDEELAIIETELKYAKAHNYTILGVGINTDSPKQYGINTVQVDSDEDLVKVVIQLRNALEE